MSVRAFVRQHRREIDEVIRAAGGCRFNDSERELWLRNDYGLYSWARSAGVPL